MICHTMIVAFENPIPDADLDQYLKDIEALLTGSGHVTAFAARRHIRVPGDDLAPLFVPTAVVQVAAADREALDAVFAVPGIEDVIGRWQARHPYKVVWANHEPLA
ncbi:hypothetical protein [Streptomyces sp. NPDC020917]|uniref:hypothetical protein n=1 Tax=Streptomyces sp. NPDC020917 TaxID=3365102 RepID=UPI0037BB3F25